MHVHELTGHESAAELSDRPGSPLSTLHPATATAQPVRSQEHAQQNRYVVRFELPGLDADQDLEVTVDAHVLSVRVERPDPLSSSVKLPAEVNDRDVAATYRNGILEVSVGWTQLPTARRIRVLTLADSHR